MIGTSDQSCWLAEGCKILILLLQHGHFAQIPSQNSRGLYHSKPLSTCTMCLRTKPEDCWPYAFCTLCTKCLVAWTASAALWHEQVVRPAHEAKLCLVHSSLVGTLMRAGHYGTAKWWGGGGGQRRERGGERDTVKAVEQGTMRGAGRECEAPCKAL